MAVRFDDKTKVFHLETNHTEYQFKIDEVGILQHLYYGRKLGGQDMSYLFVPVDRGFSGNPYELRGDRGHSPDVMPQEFSGCGVGDFRVSSMALVLENGSRSCDPRYVRHEIKKNKSAISNLPSVRQNGDAAQELHVVLADALAGLEIELIYAVLPEKDVITRRTVFRNIGTSSVKLEKAASMSIDFMHGNYDLIHFHGRHAMEREMERQALTHGIKTIGSRRGMSSHHENPFVILCDHNATEESGDCYGFMFVYSGNHKTEVELDQANSTRLVMGLQDENFDWQLKAGDAFDTPEVILSYSAEGLGTLSRQFHRIIRENICDPKYLEMRRPILINNWEATYFSFDTDKIKALADQAAEIGIEMLVLDDGWFGKRDDDNSGLGDWFVNDKKLPGGLKVIADYVNGLGMKFGLWFEPEMVNEDSDLYRTHPDWALCDPGRKPMLSRNQMVLDMGNPAVVDYLYERMSSILESANIEYVKWDFNRSVANVYSGCLPADRQGEAAHRFMLGTYALLSRLLERFPHLMIEGCSGGGGRFDAGMLYYCPQIWCSDDTDPIARLGIQYGTSFGYPVSAVGSHVSASPNHQTGRITSLKTRGVVAMAGTFGYELDLSKLNDTEKDIMRGQIADFHKYYDVIQKGNYYRLTNVQEDRYFAAWEFAAKDQREALLNVVVTDVQANPEVPCIKLRGLDETAEYRIEGTELVISGAALMYGGYVLQDIVEVNDASRGSYPAYQIHFEKLN